MSGFQVVAVMLAHNPDPVAFRRAIGAVTNQTVAPASFMIVDNGSDPPVEAPTRFPMHIHRLDRNLGVGAGHNWGWRRVLESEDTDYLWVLEHDSIPDPDCLESLLGVAQTKGSDVGALKPVQHEGIASTSKGDPITTTTLSFNGLLLPTKTLREIGFLREDFFVGQEDREFGSRLQRAGLQILKVPAAGVEHPNKGVARRGEVSVSRHYYSKRNLIYRQHGARSLPVRLSFLVLESLRVVGSLFVRRPYPHSFRRTAARLCGTLDGSLGRLGQRKYWFMSE